MVIGTSLGIEIQGRDLRIAAIQQTFNRLRLLYLEEVANFLDLSVDEQRSAVEAIVNKRKIQSAKAFLTLPRDRGMVRQLEFPLEVRSNLQSAVALQLEALCPWPLDEIYWTFNQQEIKAPPKVVVTAIVIPRANLDVWVDLFKSAKLALSGASLAPAACAHGICALWPDSKTTILLDCEAGYVDGLLVSSGRLHSVRETGQNSAAAKSAIEQLLSAGRVQNPEEVRLLVCGATANLLEEVESVPVPLLDAPANTISRFGAIASALNEIHKTGFDGNVLPSELRFRRSQLALVPTYALVVLAFILGCAMLIRASYQSTVYSSKLDHEIKVVAPQARQVAAQATELDRLALKYRALLGNLQQRDFALDSLRELAVSLPPTAWLTNYGYQDGAITVTGTATSASEVQKILEDTALFKDVQFTSSVARDPDGREHFSLKASIEVSR